MSEESRTSRRLAAILAADVAGYSRLMGADEEGTLNALKGHRRELVDPLIAQHQGRIVKTTGDGLLIEFASIVDAVRCAVVIQQGMKDRNASVEEGRRIRFRVGINVGDVIIDEGDIFGDGVNVAARLEGLSEPGEICVSATVREHVGEKLPIGFVDLGEHSVKNIARPVHVYRIEMRAEPTVAIPSRPSGVGLPDRPTIAVLPFANMSGDAEQEYFSDGISEDIVTGLSRNRMFFVISRSSSFSFRGAAINVAEVARALAVRYVLEGSVRKAGKRVRVTAQLIDATTGHHLWADRYDRDLDDIFAVQDEITQNIIGAIAPGIVTAEISRAQRKDAAQLDAWDCTMRANWHIRRFTREDSIEAIRLLEQALGHDPKCAPALADLALAHHFQAVFGWSESPDRSHEALGEAARRAVGADDQDASAHTALAIHDLFSGRHEEAERRLKRAIDLNPNLAFARGYLGVARAFGGNYDAAMPELAEAVGLSPRDPLLVIWNIAMGWASFTAGRYGETVEHVRRAIEVNPDFTDNHGLMAAACAALDDSAGATAAFAEFSRRMPALRAGDPRLIRPFKRREDAARFAELLTKAGLPIVAAGPGHVEFANK